VKFSTTKDVALTWCMFCRQTALP